MKLSFVIPCYNSQKTIEKVLDRLEWVMLKNEIVDYEVVLVNDCSKDNTIGVLYELSKKRKYLRVIDFAKNFGQHAAILAGFNHVSGDIVITLDDDGQTPVENVPSMIEKLKEGYDVVSAKYIKRNQPSGFRRLGSFLNKKMSNWLIERPEGIAVSVFLVMERFVVDEIIKYKQAYPYLSGLVLRVTHNIANVEMEQAAREVGQSGYSLKKLISLWVNGFTAFSIKPLRVATFMGLGVSGCGFLFAIFTIVRNLLGFNIQAGWSTLVCLIAIIGGLILFMLGICGEYLGRIYLCMNNTPQYVIKAKKGFGYAED